jgi:hypothetical protein
VSAAQGAKKELAPLIRLAEEQGWVVKKTRHGHLQWVPPNGGAIVHTSSTPSDVFAIKKIRRDLERSGLRLTEEP